jgi:glycosyltransferase involved in cell wall biosynthesis
MAHQPTSAALSPPRRTRPTVWQLRAYRAAAATARTILRLRPGARPAPGDRPKVTILLQHAWGMGGTIRATLNVAGHLARDYDVEILSVLRRRDEPFFPFPPGVSVTAIDDQRRGAAGPGARLLRRVHGRLFHPDDKVFLPSTLWTDVQLLRHLWRVRSGVLMGTRPALNMLVTEAVRPGLAVVAVEHTTWRAYRDPLRQGIRRRYPHIDAVVVLNDGERRRFERALKGATPVFTIPNAAVEPTGPPSPLDRPVVLAAGRLARVKGFDRLVRAYAIVARERPEWRLRICGDGEERAALAAQIDELGIAGHVELAGTVGDMEREMEQASMFVLTSRAEGLPLVMLEAMGKGLPVVSFRSPGGLRQFIEDGVDGIFVKNRDTEALARAIVGLIDDAGERRRLGAAGREKARRYGMTAVGARWRALVAGLLAEDRSGAVVIAVDPAA